MSSQTFPIDNFEGRTLSVALFKNVKGVGELKGFLTSSANDDCAAILKADLVPDVKILQLCAFKVLSDEKSSSLKTKNLHTELVYNISGSKHVAETLKRFGVSDDTTNLIIARFDASEEQWARILERVQGELKPLDELANLADFETIDKYYKLTKAELATGPRMDAICLRIASRDYV